MPLARSVLPDFLFLLAQEGAAFLLCVNGNHYYHRSDCQRQEDFHARRIARTPESVLYRQFADSEQICKPVLTRFSQRGIMYPPLISRFRSG